jgi:hypothetical protein
MSESAHLTEDAAFTSCDFDIRIAVFKTEGLLTLLDFTGFAKDLAVGAKLGQKSLTESLPLDRLRLAHSVISVG